VGDPASTAAPTDPRDDAESAPSLDPVSEPLRIAVVVYGDLDSISGGFRYDREVISRLRARGDTVDVISLPWRWYGRGLVDAFDPRIRKQLDRDVDVLVEYGLCHPSSGDTTPSYRDPTRSSDWSITSGPTARRNGTHP